MVISDRNSAMLNGETWEVIELYTEYLFFSSPTSEILLIKHVLKVDILFSF